MDKVPVEMEAMRQALEAAYEFITQPAVMGSDGKRSKIEYQIPFGKYDRLTKQIRDALKGMK